MKERPTKVSTKACKNSAFIEESKEWCEVAGAPDSSSDDTIRGEQTISFKRSRQLKIGSPSIAEWSYIVGLYFADGNRDQCCSYRVRFSLQGNEEAVARKITEILEKAGFHPRIIVGESGVDDIIVRTYSKSLFEYLPDKRVLVNDETMRQRFFQENRLFSTDAGIPFLAGLIDGDGCCPVRVIRRSSPVGLVSKWNWSFEQARLPFLIEYIVKFVESFAPKSINVLVKKGGRKRVVYFRKSATIALLHLGIAKYSWKANSWIEAIGKFQKESLSYHTTGRIARMFGVSSELVMKWIKTGVLECSTSLTRDRRKRRWCYVSNLELDKFKSEFLERKTRTESVKNNGEKLTDVAKALGVKYHSIYGAYRRGEIHATLVHDSGHPHTYLIIPKQEVEYLKKRYAGKKTTADILQ